MIKEKTQDALEATLAKATTKSEDHLPAVEIIEFGFYKVEGSRGRWYDVRIGRTEDQEYFIACQCQGSLNHRACYHAARVFDVHKLLGKFKSVLAPQNSSAV